MKPLVFALLLLAGNAFAQEDKLIARLQSGASVQEKADACLELARVGTRQAVPVLAALLADEQLSHRARFALEPIADPSVDDALRQALDRVKGPLLAGVIHSLGVRRDARAVEPLSQRLTDADPGVARAAAQALGRIGVAGVPALRQALATESAAMVPVLGDALLRGAEGMAGAEAVAVCDQLRGLTNSPPHVRLAALRGAIRSRGPGGVLLLLEAVRTDGSVSTADVLRISADLPGTEVSRALAGLVGELSEEKQVLVLRTLGWRGDVAVAGAVGELARSGSASRRVMAVQCLVQLHEASSLGVLAGLVRDPEPRVAAAAWSGLTAWPGSEADATVVSLLGGPDSKTRVAAMAAAGQRRIASSVPALLKAAAEADEDVGSAGFKALGELGGEAELPGVVDALLTTSAVAEGEAALTAIGERQPVPASCVERLLPGLARAKGEARLALLRVVGGLGGPRALEVVRAAVNDADEPVRETAWRALCDWPTPEALDELGRMSRGSADPKLRRLALRGELRLIPLRATPPAERVGLVQEALPVIEQFKEERLALSVLGELPCAESLALVVPYLSRGGFQQEANVAAVAIGEKIVAARPAEVGAALRLVRTKDETLDKRVRQVLAQVPAGSVETGFKSIFNGQDLTGWEGKPGAWNVVGGVLTAESTPEKPCTEAHYLFWRGGEPADFELIAEFRLSGAGNSGIQLRSRALPNWDTSGYQADMSGDGALVGFVYEHHRGLIAGRGERVTMGADGKRGVEKLGDAVELGAIYRKEDWNTYRVLCRGSEITLFINGTLMCQFTDHDPKEAASKGVIALQMHPGPPMKIEFRNLRLREW